MNLKINNYKFLILKFIKSKDFIFFQDIFLWKYFNLIQIYNRKKLDFKKLKNKKIK